MPFDLDWVLDGAVILLNSVVLICAALFFWCVISALAHYLASQLSYKKGVSLFDRVAPWTYYDDSKFTSAGNVHKKRYEAYGYKALRLFVVIAVCIGASLLLSGLSGNGG